MSVSRRHTTGKSRAVARARQDGIVFYLVIIGMAMALTTITLAMSGFATKTDARGDQAERILQETRKLIIGHLVNADLDAGRRLGEFRLFADLPINAGAGGDATEPNYDGYAEVAGCATRVWNPGQALTAVTTAGADARCFGRLPWRTLGLSIPDAGDDPDAYVPWIHVSPNLAINSACLPNLHPANLGQAFAGFGCLGPMPYPWITVVDERGNLLSDRVAVAIILPGPAVQGQLRGPASAPAAYLDSVTINPGCPAPCQPGTYNNANYTQANNQPTVLIKAKPDDVAAARQGFYAAPYNYNDRLVYITIDELMAALEARARTEIKRRLEAFKTAHGYYPFASDLISSTGLCVTGSRLGRLPLLQGTCAAGDVLNLPTWLTDAGWHRYFIYSVSPRCIPGNPACNAPGLTVAANNAVNALLLSPGAPIIQAPFAPSRGTLQSPLAGLTLSANPADYLDAVENAGGATDVFDATSGQPAPNNDRLEILN